MGMLSTATSRFSFPRKPAYFLLQTVGGDPSWTTGSYLLNISSPPEEGGTRYPGFSLVVES